MAVLHAVMLQRMCGKQQATLQTWLLLGCSKTLLDLVFAFVLYATWQHLLSCLHGLCTCCK